MEGRRGHGSGWGGMGFISENMCGLEIGRRVNHVECVSMCVGGQAGALSFAERAEQAV